MQREKNYIFKIKETSFLEFQKVKTSVINLRFFLSFLKTKETGKKGLLKVKRKVTKQRKRNKNFLEKSSPGIHFELIFSTGVVKTGVAKTGVAKNGFKDYVLTKLSHQDTNVVSQRFPNCVFITNQFFQTIFTIKALLWKASQESRAPKWGAVNSIFGVGG